MSALGLGVVPLFRPTWVKLLNLFLSGNQLYVLLTHHLYFIYFLYLGLYILGTGASIS